MKKYPENIQKSLLELLKQIETEDTYTRQRLLRECKQLELYWHGFQRIFWDENVQDFRVPTQDVMDQVSSREEVKLVYDYVVNIFKAHGLSIVAALAAEVPGVVFSPEDSDNPRDVLAARKAETLGKVIQKYNKSKLLFYHALFTLFTNQFVAAYNYYDRNEKFGTIEVPTFKMQNVKDPDTYYCPECDQRYEQELVNCPECSGDLTKEPGQESKEPTQTGTKKIDRGMTKIVVRGALNVKIPAWATDQESCGYLIDYSDQHFAYLRHLYPELDRDSISSMGSDNFERMARMISIGRLYSDTYLQSLLTLKKIWLRPWMYDSLDEDEANELRKSFPKGVFFTVIDSGDDLFAEARPEMMDDHWTITKGDLSRSVIGDPLGKPLLPLQDLENMVTNLLVESLEHSVPSSFADPEMVDFELYSKQEVLPGAIYPLKNSLNPNRRTEDYFFTMKTSTLPKEGVDFDKIVESKGQFVVGAFPSIFGGPQTQGSKTLGEYQESRNYALQRLSIPYQFLYFWWSDVLYKGVKDHVANMIDDEKYPTKTQDGRFENINLLMDDFSTGRFNLLIPESALDLPVSYSTKRSTVQQIIQMNSDLLNGFLFSPENKKFTLRLLGIEELNDLDSNQTIKQLLEIEALLKGSPIPNPQTGQDTSSVPIEPEVDDDDIHLRILKTFLSSELGQGHKKNNPEGYTNCLLHAKEHKDALQAAQAAQMAQQPQNSPNPKVPMKGPQNVGR